MESAQEKSSRIKLDYKSTAPEQPPLTFNFGAIGMAICVAICIASVSAGNSSFSSGEDLGYFRYTLLLGLAGFFAIPCTAYVIAWRKKESR